MSNHIAMERLRMCHPCLITLHYWLACYSEHLLVTCSLSITHSVINSGWLRSYPPSCFCTALMLLTIKDCWHLVLQALPAPWDLVLRLCNCWMEITLQIFR